MESNISNFLETLIVAMRIGETPINDEVQNDDKDIKPGGYDEDIFIFLSDRERDEYGCNICYKILMDAHQCCNKHKFCYSCIYVWSKSDRIAADSCPVCRCDGEYARIENINERLNRKRVKCISEDCNWRGFLLDYSGHDHRNYDFRELKSTLEFPQIIPTNSTLTSSTKPPTPTGITASISRPTMTPRRVPSRTSILSASSTTVTTTTGTSANNNTTSYNSSTRLPSISTNINNNNNLNYRRLAPTYADRRRTLITDGHERLAMMLILLTSDVGERFFPEPQPSIGSIYRNSTINPTPPTTDLPETSPLTSSILTSNNSTTNYNNNQSNSFHGNLSPSSPTRPLAAHDRSSLPRYGTGTDNVSSSSTLTSTSRSRLLNRSRLNEFRTLNRQLTHVANSLDRLIESTGRTTTANTNHVNGDNDDDDDDDDDDTDN